MASTSETGHAKNLGNFNTLIAAAEGMNTAYVPSNTTLKIANLRTQEAAAKALNIEVKDAKTNWATAVNSREAEFEDLKPLATRVVNAFEAALPNNQAAIADLRALNRKLQGSKKKKPAADPTPESISTSQQSYDQQADHFRDLISFLKAHPAYAPNEEKLRVGHLEEMLTRMEEIGQAVAPTETAYKNALTARNKAFYEPVTGLVDTAKAVKKYVKSVYNATAPEYKVFSKIPFRNVKDR